MFDTLKMNTVPLVTAAMAKYEFDERIRQKFTLEDNFEETYTMYRESPCGKFIYVPREVCPIGTKDLRVKGHTCGMISKVKPRNSEQARVIKESTALLKEGRSHCMRAPTGFGKSVVALDIIAKINKPTLIIVPKDDLMEQWLDNVRTFLKIPENRIGVIQQDICDFRAKWVVVGMLHSIAKESRYPRDMYNHFGLVLTDENHRAAADHFSTVMQLFPAYLRLGISATQKRKDGRDKIIQANIGPVLVETDMMPMDFKVVRYESSWECPRRQVVTNKAVEYRRVEHSPARCGHIINSIAKHEPTNRKIAWLANAAYKRGRHMIVFSDRVDHLEHLMELTRQEGVPARDMDYYVGARNVDGKRKTMNRGELEAAKGKRILFATYSKMKEGTDLPWFDTLILGTPRSDVEQVVGRIIREYEDKKMPMVFDFNYRDSNVFKSYGKSRIKFYESKNAVINFK